MGRTTFSWAVSSDPGLRRSSNEDSYCTRPDLGLFVVADGMRSIRIAASLLTLKSPPPVRGR